MKISIIIPVYSLNKDMDAMADEAFRSAWMTLDFDEVDAQVEFIAVDDGSPIPFTNGFGETIRLDENSGYSHAVNTGLAAAHGDILVVGNSDITFLHGWLTGLVRALEMGYDIVSIPTSDQSWDTRDEITEGDKFGALFAMTREAYEFLGGFDEQFRGYFADTDLRRRALERGLRIGKNWNYIVEHKAKATYEMVDSGDEEYETAVKLYKKKWGNLK